MNGALQAVRARRSWSKVTDAAPTRAELLTLVSAAGRVADHSSLRPWRLIELRGDDRHRLGEALALAQGDDRPSTKPLRAPLLIAVVASFRPSTKVPRWEQEAVASGVAHMLSLLLDEAGWGVIWRTGRETRSTPVARAHGLGDDEELLGWLYVGGKPAHSRPGRRAAMDAAPLVTRMPSAARMPSSTTLEGAAEGEETASPVRVDDPAAARPGKRAASRTGKKAKRAAKKAKKKAKRARKKQREKERERAAKAEKRARKIAARQSAADASDQP